MSSPFQGKLIVSDIDETLLYDGTRIPPRNLEAIQRFQEGGGHFALATGRAWQSTIALREQLGLTTPCVYINGGCIYDHNTDTFLSESYLPAEADAFLEEMYHRFPTAALELFTRENLGVVRENGFSAYHRRVVVAPVVSFSVTELPAKKYKVLWMDEAETVEQMRIWFAENAPQGIASVRSNANYFEIMPEGVDKGSGMCWLRDWLHIRPEDTCAIGDFENDVPMLEKAGISATPAGSHKSAKQAATLHLGPCTEGAVADLINYLEQKERMR